MENDTIYEFTVKKYIIKILAKNWQESEIPYLHNVIKFLKLELECNSPTITYTPLPQIPMRYTALHTSLSVKGDRMKDQFQSQLSCDQ